MIEYDISYSQKFIINEEIEEYIGENRDALQYVKSGCPGQSGTEGWADIDEWANDKALERLILLSEKVRSSADAMILTGVGGSNNAARAVIATLGDDKDNLKIIYAGNSTSSSSIIKALDEAKDRSVYVNIIAKNFETLEPGVSFRVLRKFLYERYGKSANGRIIATGTRGSSLERLSKDQGYEFLTFPENIGGRFSALCDVGLFPMAAAGADIREVVRGAKDMRAKLLGMEDKENPAMRYAAARNLLIKKGYAVEMLSFFEPGLSWFAKWWAQLFGESEGKDNKGLFPAAGQYSEELHSIGQFMQEGSPVVLETFLKVKDQGKTLIVEPDGIEDGFKYLDGKSFSEINNAAFEATLMAHSKRLPCFVLTLDRIDEYNFGQLFYFFEFACSLSAKMLGVEPFNQPGVEAYKKSMFKILGRD